MTTQSHLFFSSPESCTLLSHNGAGDRGGGVGTGNLKPAMVLRERELCSCTDSMASESGGRIYYFESTGLACLHVPRREKMVGQRSPAGCIRLTLLITEYHSDNPAHFMS